MAPMAPRPAPAPTPTSPGSASGLRKSPCITAPETASAAPTRMPSASLGRRMSKRMMASRAAISSPRRTWPGTGQNRVPDAPVPRLSTETTVRSTRRKMAIRRPAARLSPAAGVPRAEGLIDATAKRLTSRRVERLRQRAHSLRRARSEAQHQKPRKAHDGAALGGGCRPKRGGCADLAVIRRVVARTVHHQDDIGPGQEDGLVAQLLVTFEALHGVDPTGQRDDAFGGCIADR